MYSNLCQSSIETFRRLCEHPLDVVFWSLWGTSQVERQILEIRHPGEDMRLGMWAEVGQQLPHSFMSIKTGSRAEISGSIQNYWKLFCQTGEAILYFLCSSQKGSFLKLCDLSMCYSELFPCTLLTFKYSADFNSSKNRCSHLQNLF